MIALKPDVKQVCEPMRRRSSKEKEVEKQTMQKFIRLGVLEPSVSPWATTNVFVRKKSGGLRVTSNFRRLNDLTVMDSHPMKNMTNILDWLGSKRVFSVFDLKDVFFSGGAASSIKRMHSDTSSARNFAVQASPTRSQEFSGHISTYCQQYPG